uniref:Uncharacterized protein n=1 Tax=Arion vulgaris TaxID=1028688 RepID=A0A0B6YX81_9EUPU
MLHSAHYKPQPTRFRTITFVIFTLPHSNFTIEDFVFKSVQPNNAAFFIFKHNLFAEL